MLNLENLNDYITKASDGDHESLSIIFEALTVDIKRMARGLMAKENVGHTLQPTALMNELYLQLAKGKPVTWDSPEDFLAYIHTVMKNILINYARAKRSKKRGGNHIKMSISDANHMPYSDSSIHNIENIDLVNSLLGSLETSFPHHARVIKCKYYFDDKLTNEEIGQLCNLSPSQVKRYELFARKWMEAQYQSTKRKR